MKVSFLGKAALVASIVLSSAGCGTANPYQSGTTQFLRSVPAHSTGSGQAWTVYDANADLTVGHFWYRRQISVVYVDVVNTRQTLASNIVIHCGKHTYRPKRLAFRAHLDFYIRAYGMPASVSVSWVGQGITRHLVIPGRRMITLGLISD